MDIKITEENDKRMTVRVGLFYVFLAHLFVFLPLIIAAFIFVISTVSGSYQPMLIIPIIFIWSIVSAFILGRSLNSIAIDREHGDIKVTNVGPWLPGKQSIYDIKSIVTLDFIFTGHSTPLSNYLILLRDEEAQSLNDKWKPLSCKMVLHERWWWLLSEESTDEKHMKIAEYIGVKYRKRLYTERGWKTETY